MKMMIKDETPFIVNKRAFMLGVSSSGYTLKCNPDYNPGEPIVDADWSAYSDPIPADYPCTVECASGVWWMLDGNVGEVSCVF
jgi:hypothetical protein